MAPAAGRILGACIAAWLAAATAAAAGATIYRVDPARTLASFSVVHLGHFRAHGRLAVASGRIALDPAAHDGRVDFDLDAASVATGWDLRDAFVRGERMFDAARHPVLRFRSTRLVYAGGRLARVDGDLTLRGVTRPVALAVVALACGAGDACDAEATATIRRSDFAMGFAWPLIDDAVDLDLVVHAVRE